MLNKIGVIEGFFGPEWKCQDRIDYADFLNHNGGGFYIFAPKRCKFLRKFWKSPFPSDEFILLQNLRQYYKDRNVLFGIGLSPFELYQNLTEDNKNILFEKLDEILSLKIDYLGLFFDDMKAGPNMAKQQIVILEWILQKLPSHIKVLFCPSYYSFDPILDRVFGERPKNYLEEIGEHLDLRVEIMWTGPKVISQEISLEHIEKVTDIIKRPPFLWENYFANDGPKNCHFLKMRPYFGRDYKLLNYITGIGFNLMNQPKLSTIIMQSVFNYFRFSQSSKEAFSDAIKKCSSDSIGQLLMKYHSIFDEYGRNNLTDGQKEDLEALLAVEKSDIGLEIIDWLRGDYVVGNECLTD